MKMKIYQSDSKSLKMAKINVVTTLKVFLNHFLFDVNVRRNKD